MSESPPLVALRGAALGYDGVAVLHDVELAVGPGELIAIAGPNGAGKTTLFRTMLGFLPALGGTVSRSCALDEIGYVPQSAALDATFPITAREVVEMGAYGRVKPYQAFPERERRRRKDVIEQVGLGHLAERLFFSLSGGQRQRMLIARALMAAPSCSFSMSRWPAAIPSRRRRSAICWSLSAENTALPWFFPAMTCAWCKV
jgi:ABC-type Mn2+/Zn2+ transport system ATPase subunit